MNTNPESPFFFNVKGREKHFNSTAWDGGSLTERSVIGKFKHLPITGFCYPGMPSNKTRMLFTKTLPHWALPMQNGDYASITPDGLWRLSVLLWHSDSRKEVELELRKMLTPDGVHKVLSLCGLCDNPIRDAYFKAH